MGLETGTGIGDLVPTNPLSTDAVSVGDDHIRLIKTVMKSITFLKSVQTFTASGTWTRPANVRLILVYCLGGGGGGGGGAVAGYSGGGGASGATAIKWVDVSASPSGTVTIGSGGTGGAIAGPGGAGGSTYITIGGSNICLAQGAIAQGIPSDGGNRHPASASVGDIVFTGNLAQYGRSPATGLVYGSTGAGSGGSSDGAAPANSGGGGGGGSASSGAGNPGQAGGSGYCIVFEFGW